MESLLKTYQKSQKADSYRPADTPNQYNDRIAALNALGANQYEKVNTQTMNRISKDNSALTQNASGNSVIPGAR